MSQLRYKYTPAATSAPIAIIIKPTGPSATVSAPPKPTIALDIPAIMAGTAAYSDIAPNATAMAASPLPTAINASGFEPTASDITTKPVATAPITPPITPNALPIPSSASLNICTFSGCFSFSVKPSNASPIFRTTSAIASPTPPCETVNNNCFQLSPNDEIAPSSDFARASIAPANLVLPISSKYC